MKVLVVDNEINIREGVLEMIGSFCEGVTEIHEADGVTTGIQKIEEVVPDVVFLDLHMPLMNGFQLLDDLENSRAFVQYPIDIYLLSSSCDYNDFQTALNKRLCQGFINKPLNQKKLNNLIKTSQKEKVKSVFWG